MKHAFAGDKSCKIACVDSEQHHVLQDGGSSRSRARPSASFGEAAPRPSLALPREIPTQITTPSDMHHHSERYIITKHLTCMLFDVHKLSHKPSQQILQAQAGASPPHQLSMLGTRLCDY